MTSRTSLGTLSGHPIRELRIETLAPRALPGAVGLIDRLHVRTQQGTVRRQLLFAAGDTVDTLKVAESLRRLRAQRYLADVWLDGRRCLDENTIDLTLTTRDARSTRPRLRVGGSSETLIGIEDRNLLGTGREASVYLRADGSRVGLGVLFSEPWLPATNLAAVARLDSYKDGREWLFSVGTRRRSVFDPWHAEVTLSRSTRGSLSVPGDAFRREEGALLVAKRVSATPSGVLSMLIGAEAARAVLVSSPTAMLVGPSSVRRSFAGMALGLRRESASYDTVSWLGPGQALFDLPRGLESEVVVGGGRDFVSQRAALHLDMWGGQMWLPDRRHLIVGDVWASGYLLARRWDAATVRASLTLYRGAWRGVWVARLAGERLINPDPDVRALTTTDPALSAFPDEARLAKTALAGSLERTAHLTRLTRAVGLQGAVFGAASVRYDPAAPGRNRLHVGVLGAGLRVAPNKVGRGTVRLDIGYPVVRSSGLSARPFVSLSIAPGIGTDRERVGRRRP